MKVLFDHQAFSMQKYGGISRYFANLHYGINAQGDDESKLGLLFTDNAYINNKELPGGIFNKLITKSSRRYKYNKWYGKHLLKQNDFDVFHPTYYHSYFLKKLQKPFVLTVHDMIHELYPGYFLTDPYKNYKSQVIERADNIIAISECTKNDIQKFYNIADSKISVIHHGYKMHTADAAPTTLKIDGEYLLFVGDRDNYKNFNLFVKAAAPIIVKHGIKLICAGGGNFKSEELGLLKQLGIVNSVTQTQVNDSGLKFLYQNALAFVYPSLYEGFGLPVLEAFFNGCPVVMSNTSSLPEVGGDSAAYFNPKDEQAMAFTIEQVISNQALRETLKTKGRDRLKQFGFDVCLQKTLKVYNSLI
jgi:glycosyltransferase involved in cell wall biosynthesis